MALEFKTLERRVVSSTDGNIISFYDNTMYIPFHVAIQIGICDSKRNLLTKYIDLKEIKNKIYLFSKGSELPVRNVRHDSKGFYIPCMTAIEKLKLKDKRMKYNFIKTGSSLAIVLSIF